MSFKPIDIKRDEFRKYLERTGVLEAISKVLVKLFRLPERPENTIEFLRANLGDAIHQEDTIEALKLDLEDARNTIDQLKRSIENLKSEKSSNIAATATEITDSLDKCSIKQDIITPPHSQQSAIELNSSVGTINRSTTENVPIEHVDSKDEITQPPGQQEMEPIPQNSEQIEEVTTQNLNEGEHSATVIDVAADQGNTVQDITSVKSDSDPNKSTENN